MLVSESLLLNYSRNTCCLNSACSFNLACLLEVGQEALCTVLVGSKAFIKAYLARKGTHIWRGFNVIKRLLNPGWWPHPDIPAQQMLWILTLACLQFTGDYWIRHVRPDYTIEFAESNDAGVKQLFQMCVGGWHQLMDRACTGVNSSPYPTLRLRPMNGRG